MHGHVKRVLVVTAMYPRPATPVAGVFVYDQVHALRRLGLEVEVLDLGPSRGLLKYVRGCWRVFGATLRQSFDVVHGHYGFAGLVARAQVRAAVVVTFHGSDVNLRNQRP